MKEPLLPSDEFARLAAIEALGVLYTPAEERFDRITRLAKKVFDVPISLVTLVAEKCQWFKSRQGYLTSETSRHVSLCAHAILGDEPFLVPDTLKDERFRDNPLVTGEPFIRFYAAVVLADQDGHRLGTLCIIDTEPRTIGPTDIDTFQDLGTWAENELRLCQLGDVQKELVAELDSTKRQAMLDPLTQTWNRRAFAEIFERDLARSLRHDTPISVLLFDIDHFKAFNDNFGHQAGDEVLVETVHRARSTLRSEDALCRFGGEEFVVILSGCAVEGALAAAEKLRKRIAGEPILLGPSMPVITVSVGVASWSKGQPFPTTEALIRSADAALYAAKRHGRNRTMIADEAGRHHTVQAGTHAAE